MKFHSLMNSRGLKKVATNFSWLMVMQIIDKLVPLVVIPYLIATLGFDRWGVIGFAQSFGMYALILMDYGFAQTALRDISQNRDQLENRARIFNEVLWSKLGLGIAALSISLFLAWFIPVFRPDFILFAGAVMLYFGQSMFPVWFWQGMENMHVSTLLSSISRLVFLGLIFVFVHQASDQSLVLWLQAAGAWLAAIAGIVLGMVKYGIKPRKPDFPGIKRQLAHGAPVFLSNLAISLYTNTRGFMIGLVSSQTIMGYYYLAEKLVSFLGIPFGMVSQALFPRLSKLWHEAPDRFHVLYRRLVLGSMTYAVLLMPLAILAGPSLLGLLSNGAAAPECISFFNILIFTLFFIHSNSFRVQSLLVTHKSHTYMKIHLAGGMSGIILLVSLSLLVGPWGTTSAALISEALVMAYALAWTRGSRSKPETKA